MKKKFTRLLIGTALLIIFNLVFSDGAASLTIKEEEELSREFQKLVLRKYRLIEDPVIVDYLNKIGQKILSQLPSQPFNYHFYVVKEDAFNAFATPAGHIYINSGLFAAMQSEDELAGILSHEISHVVSRHISQKIDRSKKVNIVTLAGVAAGIFLGGAGATAAANAVTIGSMATAQSIMLAYSREDEIQADQRGLVYLDNAGYSAAGLMTALKKIRSVRWFGSEQVPTYLMTHPAVEDRIAYIDTWMEHHSKGAFQSDSYEFRRAHTYLVANYQDESVTLKRFKEAVENHPEDPMAHYGYGLILSRTGNHVDGAHYIRAVLEKKAFDPYVLMDLGKMYIFDGNYGQALSILENSPHIDSTEAEKLFYLGKARMGLGMYREAAATFETLIDKNLEYKPAYYALGEAYDKQNQPAESHYYLGVYHKKTGKLKNAHFHLTRALRDIADPDKKQQIEKLLKELNRQIKQDSEDSR